jgi:hypothetical protein
MAGSQGYVELPTRCHVVDDVGSDQKPTCVAWSHVIASKPPGTATIALGNPPEACDSAAVLAASDGIVGVDDGLEGDVDAVGVDARGVGWLVVPVGGLGVASGAADPRPLVVVEHPVDPRSATVVRKIRILWPTRLVLATSAVRMPTPDE